MQRAACLPGASARQAVHSDKLQQRAQKEKGRLEELAKQHAQQGGSVELAPLAPAAAAVSGAASGSTGTAVVPGAAEERRRRRDL